MATNKTLRGVFSFSVTPTTDDGGRIDHDRLRQFLDFQIEQGVHGIAVFGSTGSNGSFSEEEKRETMKVAVKHVNGRVTLIFGTGAITTAEAVRQSKFAEEAGADGLLVVPITYWPLAENEVYEHYEAIATECVELFGLAVEKNDMIRSRELFDRLFPLCDFMCLKSHVRVAHTALELLGRPMGPPRRPLRMLEPRDRAELERLLREFGALRSA